MKTKETPTEISVHFARVVRFLRGVTEWTTAIEIAKGAGVAPRTARLHAARLARLGLANVEEVFGGYRYRWSNAAKGNHALIERIDRASAALNVKR